MTLIPETPEIHPQRPILISCCAILDASAVKVIGGSLLIEPARISEGVHGWRVLAMGTHREVASHEASGDALSLDLPDSLVFPGLVNAHAHLDLTHIGPRPFDPSSQTFADWVRLIRENRETEPDSIRASVQEGIRRSIEGGVIAVGDISGVGRTEPLEALRDSPMVGVSFIEFFGLGNRQEQTTREIDALLESTPDRERGITRSLQPHAPYSAGLRVYEHASRAAHERGIPITTHLAEMNEEREFVSACAGPIASFLESLSLLDDAARASFGTGRHPIEHIKDAMMIAPYLLAHVNDCPDEYFPLLRQYGAAVAFCPRAHEYFDHSATIGAHPYQRMLDAGIPVALATDSVVNLPPDQADRITPLDDARLLFSRDGTDPFALLAMLSTTPAKGLGLDRSLFEFKAGSTVLAVNILAQNPVLGSDPARAVFSSHAMPVLLAPGIDVEQTLARLGRIDR